MHFVPFFPVPFFPCAFFSGAIFSCAFFSGAFFSYTHMCIMCFEYRIKEVELYGMIEGRSGFP